MIRSQAIRSVHPNIVTTDETEAWDVNGNPVVLDESAITIEVARLQAEYDAQEYARNRQAEYPSIDELIVALWEGVVEERMASVTALEGLRQAVKDKYPKSE